MRKNFYELLTNRKFDITTEYATLWRLFCVEACYHTNLRSYPMIYWVDQRLFRNFAFRGSFATLKDMMDEFGIETRTYVDIEKLLLFCEILIAVLPEQGVAYDEFLSKQRKTIFENIYYILERTNHEIRKDPSGNWIIVEKNKATTLAAQLVEDEVFSFELIEYNHFALKGDLEGKKKLLFSIAAYIEPILKSKVLQKNGYRQLESDAGFLFNNFHIRHNNKTGASAQDYIAAVKNSELEEWYDKAYEVALSVIIINDYLTIGQDIADIKTRYTWK